ncbi:MAG: hypothetical protein JXR30_00190 [Alphaproteobacteria bacterium]|nr:hypothetical protein [Alphaproteobacteria bacterium]
MLKKILSLLISIFFSFQVVAKEVSVVGIIPSGKEITTARQLSIKFNTSVVKLGEKVPENIAVKVTPSIKCDWQWMDTSTLTCNLKEKDALKLATHYDVDVSKELFKILENISLNKSYHFEFETKRPQVGYSYPGKWLSPTRPEIHVRFSQDVDERSIHESLFFKAIGEEIKVDFEKEAENSWLVRPTKDLPKNMSVMLGVKPGLKSKEGGDLEGIESKEILQIKTFDDFEFIGLKCYSKKGEEIYIKNSEEGNQVCDAESSVALIFSSPVPAHQMVNKLDVSPSLLNENWNLQQETHVQTNKKNEYFIYLPNLSANTEYTIRSKQGKKPSFWSWAGFKNILKSLLFWRHSYTDVNGVSIASDYLVGEIQDIFGRSLETPFEVKFKTDHLHPDFDFKYREAVIEKGIENDFPLLVTNLDKIDLNYKVFESEKEAYTTTHSVKFNTKIKDRKMMIPMGLSKALKGKSALVQGSVNSSPRLPEREKYDQNKFTYLITPFAIHAKIGHFSSAIWVTDMRTGEGVPNAKVSAYMDDYNNISGIGKKIDTGKTDENGLVKLIGSFGEAYSAPYERGKNWETVLKIETEKDISWMPLNYNYEIDPYRVTENVSSFARSLHGHMKAWGLTAQGVYRAGQKIDFKIFVRAQDNETFITPPQAQYDLEITDPTGKQVKKFNNISLSDFGTYSNSFDVSKDASVGWYDFELVYHYNKDAVKKSMLKDLFQRLFGEKDNTLKGDKYFHPLRVLVSDFNASTFKITTDLNGEEAFPDKEIEIKTRVNLHAGGAYTNADVRTSAVLTSNDFSSTHPRARGFDFELPQEYQSDIVFQKTSKTNSEGEISEEFEVENKDKEVLFGELFIESSVQDDRGKSSASSKAIRYIGRDRFVGLKTESQVLSAGKKATLGVLVVDPIGNPVSDTDVRVKILHQKTRIARVKSAGNAYLSEYTNEWENSDSCRVRPRGEEDGTCIFTPKYPGLYRAEATIRDRHGRSYTKEMTFWVEGKGYVVWDAKDDNALTLVPVNKDVKVGEKAKFMVQNPFPDAKALITVERYGILDSWVQTLKGSSPVIEIPIKENYIPGVYLSVVVMSPRVDKPVDQGVDLGKPTFKMGYAKIEIQDNAKKIDFNITTNKKVYEPGEQITLTLEPKGQNLKNVDAIEAAVIVLDEGVLSLIMGGKSYFDVHKGFYSLEDLDVENYNLIMNLIGRQRFDTKGANSGGDGGTAVTMRNNMKEVALFATDVTFKAEAIPVSKVSQKVKEEKVEQEGLRSDSKESAHKKQHIVFKKGFKKQTLSFTAPDNLTGWRVLVIATDKHEKMGLSDTRFEVNKPLEIRPVMPNQVIEGDIFKAGFSVMNRTDKKQNVTVNLTITGPLAKKSKQTQKEVLSIKPFERKKIYLEAEVGAIKNQNDSEIEITARATAGELSDGLTHKVKVQKYKSMDVVASYGTTTEKNVTKALKFPQKIRADMGDVKVTVSPTVIGGITSAFEYMKTYPYTCWEQKLSKALMAAQYEKLKKYTDKDFAWAESKTLVKEILKQAKDFQAPNGGMAFFKARNDYVSPYLSVYTDIGFNALRNMGYVIPKDINDNLENYLKTALRSNVFPDYVDKKLSMDLRALILFALAQRGQVNADDVERLSDQIDTMSVFTLSHYLMAGIQTNIGQDLQERIVDKMLSHTISSAGKTSFNEADDNFGKRFLSTPLRSNCAALSALVKAKQSDLRSEMIQDLPFKIVRFITQSRSRKGHFENTQENIFCLNALLDFARVYEEDDPDMEIKVSLDSTLLGTTAFESFTDDPKVFTHDINESDPGKESNIQITKDGEGRLYYQTRLTTASSDHTQKPTNAGFDVRKEYSVERNGEWVLLADDSTVNRGELVRADLYVSIPTARNYVVVDDPVPGGLEPVNRDLANTSVLDAKEAQGIYAGGSFYFKYDDWISYDYSRWSFYHKELRNDSVRFYADYLPTGNYHLTYVAQAIAEGKFVKMPTMASEMYDSDIYGKGQTNTLTVEEK